MKLQKQTIWFILVLFSWGLPSAFGQEVSSANRITILEKRLGQLIDLNEKLVTSLENRGQQIAQLRSDIESLKSYRYKNRGTTNSKDLMRLRARVLQLESQLTQSANRLGRLEQVKTNYDRSPQYHHAGLEKLRAINSRLNTRLKKIQKQQNRSYRKRQPYASTQNRVPLHFVSHSSKSRQNKSPAYQQDTIGIDDGWSCDCPACRKAYELNDGYYNSSYYEEIVIVVR